MQGRISDHIRSNVWGIAACFLALMGTAVVASASDEGPRATAAASTTKQIKKLKRKDSELEARLAALEGRPGPTIPTSLPPTGPASGELAGTYPSPTIGTVSGLDLAASTSPTGGINFGGDTNLYRSTAGTVKTDNSLVVSGNTVLGDNFSTDQVTVQGWLKLSIKGSAGAPPATECQFANHVGRIVFNTGDNRLYLCDIENAWISVPLA